MGKHSLPQMSALVGLDDGDAGPLPDLQSQAVIEANAEVSYSRDKLLSEVLFDLSEQEKREKIDLLVTRHAEVVDHWRKAGKHYLGAGRALLLMKRELPQVALDRLLASYDRNQQEGVSNWSALPFSQDTALRLMKVAEMVITGRFEVAFRAVEQQFSEDLLPPYTVAYEFSKLPEDNLEDAVRAGLIRPDVPKREVIEFVSTFRKAASPKSAADFPRRLAKLDAKLRRAYEEVRRLEADRRDLLASNGVGDPAHRSGAVMQLGNTAPERAGAEERDLDAA